MDPTVRPRRPRPTSAIVGFVAGIVLVVSLAGLIAWRFGWFEAAASGAILDTRPKSNFTAGELRGQALYYANCASCMTASMRQMMAPPGAPKMLAFKDKLSGAEIDAVLAYIKTMWFDYQREQQAELTQAFC